MKKQFFEKQIIAILHEGEADGAVITEIRHKHNVNNQTFFRWRHD